VIQFRHARAGQSAIAILLAVVVGLSAGCTPAGPGAAPAGGAAAPAQGQTLKVGVLVHLTGPFAETGQMQQLGAQIATDEINAAGGIKSLGGAKLELVVRDAGTSVSDSVSAMQSLLASNQLVAGIGTGLSSNTLAIVPIAEQNRMPWLDVSFEDKITESGYKFIFASSRKQSTLSDTEFPGLVDIAKQAGVNLTRVGLITSPNVTNTTAADLVRQQYAPRFGWSVVMDQNIQPGSATGGVLSTLVAQIKQADPQVMMIGSGIDDIIAINRQMIAEGARPKPWILNGAPFISKSFLDALGPEGTQGIMTIASAGVFATNKDLSAKIEQAGQVPQEYQFVPYSEMYVIAMALDQAASTDHQKVRDTIAGLDIQGGPAGSVYPCNCLRFDSTGRSATSTALVEQWQEGKVQTILPQNVATAKAIWPQ
jgi:branched-chain amino acid transport system substrate-binding protein